MSIQKGGMAYTPSTWCFSRCLQHFNLRLCRMIAGHHHQHHSQNNRTLSVQRCLLITWGGYTKVVLKRVTNRDSNSSTKGCKNKVFASLIRIRKISSTEYSGMNRRLLILPMFKTCTSTTQQLLMVWRVGWNLKAIPMGHYTNVSGISLLFLGFPCNRSTV